MLTLKILCVAEFCIRPHYTSTTNDQHLIKTKTTWLAKSAVLEVGLFIRSVTSEQNCLEKSWADQVRPRTFQDIL